MNAVRFRRTDMLGLRPGNDRIGPKGEAVALYCAQAGRCAGCRLIELPYTDQLNQKRRAFLSLWAQRGLPLHDPADLVIESLDEGGLRDRCDMTLHFENGRTVLGLWDWDQREILDLRCCPQMSPPLAAWFSDFRQRIPPIQFGNIRLRVSPDGRRGIWLDFPNKTIEALLEEGRWLAELGECALVELGQRHQRLAISRSGPVLDDAALFPWFETYLGDEDRPRPLYCTIGSFTQPGFRINRLLVTRVREMVSASGMNTWLELGAGIGNFTLPLAAMGRTVTAADMDPRTAQALRRSAQAAGLSDLIDSERVNMHHPSERLRGLSTDRQAILADPPRSGLGSYLDVLAQVPPKRRPKAVVYVSCFAESMIGDIAGLYSLGYRLRRITGLDQFPQSIHCEWLGLLTRD